MKCLKEHTVSLFSGLKATTWKPKQMVGTTLNIEPQELILKNKPVFPDEHLDLIKSTDTVVPTPDWCLVVSGQGDSPSDNI